MPATEETRKYITPYAFQVANDLLGKRLASPSKRLSAILLDMLLVGLLTTLNSLLLTGLIALVSLFGFNNLRKHADKGFAAGMLLATSIVCILIIVAALSLQSGFEYDSEEDGATVEVVVSTDDSEDHDDSESNEDTSPQSDGSTSVVQWVRGMISDLGISFGWAALYFSVFLAWFNGQTLGKLVFGIRVIRIDGRSLSLWDSFGRYGGYGAGFATGLLGFLQIYWDSNRQAIQDKISETMVIDLRKPDAKTSVNSDQANSEASKVNLGDSEANLGE